MPCPSLRQFQKLVIESFPFFHNSTVDLQLSTKISRHKLDAQQDLGPPSTHRGRLYRSNTSFVSLSASNHARLWDQRRSYREWQKKPWRV